MPVHTLTRPAAASSSPHPHEHRRPPRRAVRTRPLPGGTYAVIGAPTIAVYKRAGTAWLPTRHTSGRTDQGTAMTLRVIAVHHGFVKVRIPSRNNRETGWVRSTDVTLKQSRYIINIVLHSRQLILLKRHHTVMTFAVGIGRRRTPTPTGEFTITEIIPITQPNSIYGPCAFPLSAYSPQLPHFMGGHGQIGIHGTNQPRLLRPALDRRISHGCIRIPNHYARLLARLLQPGTPVNITR